MDVLILAAEECTYGVIPVEMNSTFEGIQRALLRKKSELPTVEKPEVNLICAECANVVWVELYVAGLSLIPAWSKKNYVSVFGLFSINRY